MCLQTPTLCIVTRSFRSSAFFRDIPPEIKALAKTALPWNRSEYTPRISGVPPHVLLLAEFKDLKVKFANLREQIRDDMVQVLQGNDSF